MNAPRHSAQLFDSAHPTGHAATVWVTPGGLHVETEAGAEHATWPFESLRLRPARARRTPAPRAWRAGDGDARHRRCRNSRRAADRVARVRRARAVSTRRAHRELRARDDRRRTRRDGRTLRMGDSGARDARGRTSAGRVERSLGESALASLAPAEKRIEDPRVIEPVETIVARLHAASGAAYRFRVVVVDQPEVNALAAPGGNIVVFRGLLDPARALMKWRACSRTRSSTCSSATWCARCCNAPRSPSSCRCSPAMRAARSRPSSPTGSATCRTAGASRTKRMPPATR